MKKDTIKYYFQYMFFFIAFGAFFSYMSVYLSTTLKFNASQVGILTSIPSLVGVFMLPFWGIITDVTKKQKTILGLNLFMASIIAYYFSKGSYFSYIFIVYSLLELFRYSLIPLSDNIVLYYCKSSNENYGFIRSAGSLGYVLGGIICACLLKYIKDDRLFLYIFSIMTMASFLIVPFLNKTESIREKLSLKNDLKHLIKNKFYIMILIVSICSFSVVDAISMYQGMCMLSLSENKYLIGFLGFFMAFPEVYIMNITGKLIIRFGYIKLFLFALVAIIIRCIIYILIKNPYVFMIVTSLNSITICFTIICGYELIKKIVEKKMHATAITILTSSMGICSCLFRLIFGKIIYMYDMKYIFIFSIIVSAIGVVTLFYMKSLNIEEYICDLR